MDIKNLQYFVKVCEYKNISKAAENLHISQQGLSVIVSKIEKEFQTPLFFRVPKGLELTESGISVYEYAKRIINIYENCITDILSNRKPVSRVRFACLHAFLSMCPSDIKSILLQEDNEYNIRTSEAMSYSCEKWLREGQCDFAAISSPFNEEDFITQKMFRIYGDFIVHKKHKLASYDKITLYDLINEKLVISSPFYKLSPTILAARYSIKLNVIYEATHPQNIPDIVAHKSDCVGCSCSVYRNRIVDPDIVVIPGDSMFAETIYLAKLKDVPLSLAAQNVWKRIIDTLPWET